MKIKPRRRKKGMKGMKGIRQYRREECIVSKIA